MFTDREITLADFAARGTDNQADETVIRVLGHVAFMAWMAEVRDQSEATCMRNYAWSSRIGIAASVSDRHALLASCGDIMSGGYAK